MAKYAFGPFELDDRQRALTRGGEALALTPKAMAVLVALVQQAGETLGKRRLLDTAWPGQFVGESVLPQNIYTLRSLFAQEEPSQVYIDTIPRRGYRFAVPVTVVESGPAPIRAVAVVQFEATPATGESAALGLAMADSVATQLSRLGRLRVLPPASLRGEDATALSPSRIAERLRVDAVVTGLVQESGGRLRINCQVVESETGASRWADSFDATLEEVFEVQDSISEALAGSLLPPESATSSSLKPVARTAEASAYRAYVRGRFLWNRRTSADLDAAIEQFRVATALDPSFSPAHAGLADALVLLPFYGGVAPQDAFPQARESALAALRLDPRSAAAHTTLAYTRFLYDWDWNGAEAEFHRALAEDPGYANAHHWYGFMLAALGRHDESLEHAQRAVELDPLSLAINSDLGFAWYFARRFDAAERQFGLALELDEGFSYARFGLSLTLEALGDRSAALEQARLAHEQSSGNPALIAAYARALALSGEVDEARAVLESIEQAEGAKSIHRALVWTGLGDVERALDHLEAACEERSRFVVFLAVWPIYDTLRASPRFDALLSRVGLEK